MSFVFVFLINVFTVYVCEVVYLWLFFISITSVALYILKLNLTLPVCIVYYFVFQEVSGLIFLGFQGYTLQSFSLFIKGGVSPFHSWMLKVLENCNIRSFSWLITIQKAPYLLVLNWFIGGMFLGFLLLVVLLPLLQGLITINIWLITFLLLTSGSNFILFVVSVSVFYLSFLVLWFYLLMSFFSLGLIFNSSIMFTFELVVMISGIPTTLSFFVKLSFLGVLSNWLGFLIIIVYFCLFLFLVLSLSYLNLSSFFGLSSYVLLLMLIFINSFLFLL